MIQKVSWMVLAMAGTVAIANAGPQEPVAKPDADFLEFIGSWHTGENRWTDPFQVEAPASKEGWYRRDGRPQDDQGMNNTRPVPSVDSKQQGAGSAVPRRDMKP